MTKNRTTNLHDPGVDVKIVLSGLWVSMLFVFAYVDIFGFWRADVINGALAGKVPGAGFEIDQTFLTLTTAVHPDPEPDGHRLPARPRADQQDNQPRCQPALRGVRGRATILGETWVYFILGSVVEVALLLTIARVAWAWPSRPVVTPADEDGVVAPPSSSDRVLGEL